MGPLASILWEQGKTRASKVDSQLVLTNDECWRGASCLPSGEQEERRALPWTGRVLRRPFVSNRCRKGTPVHERAPGEGPSALLA